LEAAFFILTHENYVLNFRVYYKKMSGNIMEKHYKERIVVDSKIHFGKPCVAGTRISVENVLELIQNNISFEKIIEEFYPDLSVEDIKACAGYALDIVRSEEIHIDTV